MIRPNFSKWGQSPTEIRRLSIEAEHPRSRERFQALYMIGTKQTNASQWAEKIERNTRTVMEWVHRYNAVGPAGIVYRHSGGRTPLLPAKSEQQSLRQSKQGNRLTKPWWVTAGP